MSITAADVNKLRKQTGAGMMDCKNALVEANGDFETAIDVLRKRGQKVAAKRGDREASEGLVMAKSTEDGKKAVLVVLNCETDFVAKNEDFGKLAHTILETAVSGSPGDVEALKGMKFGDSDLTIGEKIIEQTGVIGEKLEISAISEVTGETVFAYNHPGNKVASIVSLNKGGHGDAAKDIAMQIAAMAPIALNEDSVDQSTIDRELEVGKDLAIQEGKPAEMAEKIAQGRLKKFFKEATLVHQQYIKDNKMSVQQFLESVEGGLVVTDFKRQSLS